MRHGGFYGRGFKRFFHRKVNVENIPTWQPVVALALEGTEGRWLMHRRPAHKHHGGLWEFPGGKVEATENPREALVREIREELGIDIAAGSLSPAGFADDLSATVGLPIVILLYKTAQWAGQPQALEGGEVGWFTCEEIERLDRPPLDVTLATNLFATRGS